MESFDDQCYPTKSHYNRIEVNIDNKVYMLEGMDTAGQDKFSPPHSLVDQSIRDGECFMLVYSISARVFFFRIEEFYKDIMRAKGEVKSPIILVGNKIDRLTEREVSKKRARV
ncbi:small GTPase superfamily [Diplogelasinospora grovesii]|uniref:Small GTPase superfamily n=1 Tax=Diplogelasinospora grovesii TaxID=303347 RepID=A0AAN6N623_9PEZI|nr:small GTPase superfamily [Diplogelasinospora grovesii]